MSRKDGVLALLVVVVWGLNFVVIKVGLHNMPPLMLAGLRFMLVAFPAIFFVARPKVPLNLLLGYRLTISFAQFAFLFCTINFGMPAGLASLVLQAQAFFTIVLGAFTFGERLHGKQLAGIALAIFGVLVLIEMKIYVIKIAVHGVSPMVWRRLRIAADTSLAALHFIFQIVQGWGDDHLHQFHIYGKDYGISYEGGIGFVDNPFRVVIDDFAFDAGDRFTYEYNFFEHWLHDIRVEAIYENSTLKAPFCISGHGMPGATAADEFDKTLAFLEAIVNADDETTVGEIRPFADDLDAVRFNRHKINRQLSRLDLASPVLEPEVIWLGRRR